MWATGKEYPRDTGADQSENCGARSICGVGPFHCEYGGGVSARLDEQAPTLWATYDGWLRRATSVISDSANALNAMNVFPVPDADTGSNLKLTMTGIARAVPNIEESSLDAAAQAAVLCAHGNSGAIVAEMFVSVCRALEHDLPRLQSLPPGTLVAALLRSAAVAARRAVARPVAGTILTIADDAANAADTAAAGQPEDPLAVARAAQDAARDSLARTPEQLTVLADAGVVDAGGQAYVLLIDVLVEVLGGAPAKPLPTATAPAAAAYPGTSKVADQYEVMYALRGASPSGLDTLREQLSELGNSVVIVGDQAIARVHVHLDEAGAAVEAALPLGELSQLRITALRQAQDGALGQAQDGALRQAPDNALPSNSALQRRSVLAVVAGSGLAKAVTSLGGVPVLTPSGDVTVEELKAAADQALGDLVILPNGIENLKRAEDLARGLRRAGRRVGIVPTVAQVQGLTAMAVHEPSADLESAVVAMSTAAGHARYGAVTVAETVGMTMAGRCEPDDVLGAVEGDVVVIGTSMTEVAWQVVQRLVTLGGDLLTLVRGTAADDDLISGLTARVQERFRTIDVEVVDGGQPRYPLLLGLE
jgi:DAK2 domain fusion protein YloV